MPRQQPTHIEPKQVARMLKTHISTVYRLILHGKIPARRIGGRRYLIRREDAVKFAEGVPVVPVARVPWDRREGEVGA
jgi:excisionase family DNA binding protein